jgi:hypothetical protein
MRLLLAVALVITGALGVAFIFQGTFAANWPFALIPLAVWIALYILIRLIILVVGFALVITAVSKAKRELGNLNDAVVRVKDRAEKAKTPSDLFHD